MRLFTYVLSLVVAGILIASPFGLFAQNKKYTLSGTIYDSLTAKPVKNAKVLIAGTKYEDSTKDDGNYKIDNLIPGTNNLLVWAVGYDTNIVKFEIRKNMKLTVKLMPLPPAVVPPPSKNDTAVKDTVSATNQPVASDKKAKEKKIKSGLTDADKDQLRILIEDAIFSKSIYFQKIKEKRKSVYLEGSFSIDTGYLYEFEAKFSKKPGGGFELLWLKFEMKGRNVQ